VADYAKLTVKASAVEGKTGDSGDGDWSADEDWDSDSSGEKKVDTAGTFPFECFCFLCTSMDKRVSFLFPLSSIVRRVCH